MGHGTSSGSKLPLILGAIFIGAFIIFIAYRQKSPATVATEHAAANIPQKQTAGSQVNAGVAYAPDFTLTSLDGKAVHLADFRGQKPVVLDFFATWCPNCRRDMPQLSAMYEKYKDRVEVLGVNLHENESTVRDFIQTNGIAYPILLDPTSSAAQLYSVAYTNYHILIAKDGTLKQAIPGDMTEGALQTLLN